MTLPRILLLDLDDTILDDSGGRAVAWRRACHDVARAEPSVDAEALLARIEADRDAFWADPERHRIWRADMRAAWSEVARLALVALGHERAAELGAAVGSRHYDLRAAVRAPLPGAMVALDAFRRADVTLGLITNGGTEMQRDKIERFALADYFAYIGVEGEVGVGKPHAEAYERALRSLGAQPSDAWMVGDNLEWDVAGAQAVGISGVWLDRHGTGLPDGAIRPDRVITSLIELVPRA